MTPVQLNYRVLLSTPGAQLVPPEMRTPQRNQTMLFNPFEDESRFMRAWHAVEIARPVQLGLFTFDVSDLPYFLVCGGKKTGAIVRVTKGEVKISRPLIITPDNMRPEFEDFFLKFAFAPARDGREYHYALADGQFFNLLEIGRASCRERVYSSV